jgi:hypothetical protein
MRFLSFLLAVILLIPQVQAQTFSDLASNHWAYFYVEDLVAQGIIDDGYFFYPDRELTRAELVKIMVLATTGVVDDELPAESTFPDVSPTEWYYPFVETAKITGLIDGYPDGYFRPERNVIRAEAMKIIINGLGVAKSLDPPVKFRDYNHNEWFHVFVATAYNHDIITGKVNKRGVKQMLFGPADAITRAEMAKITSKGLAVSEMY